MVHPGEEYLAWVLPALCTATGHFLSIHKGKTSPILLIKNLLLKNLFLANLDAPAEIFTFLGFEIDIPRREVRVPESRKNKIREQLKEILSHPICDFNLLEKMRGKMCSLALVCPLTRLYIRQITHALSLAESLVQPEVALTPELMDELNHWVQDPLFLDSCRPFEKIGEIDLDFRPVITTPQGIIEYHTGMTVQIILLSF